MNSTYRITLRSVGTFDSIRIILVNYLFLPLVSLLMFLLIAFNSNQYYTRSLIGTIVTTGITTSIGIISASVVYDQNIGLLEDFFSIRPAFHKYWIPKFVIANITATIEIVVLGGIGLVSLGETNLLPKLFLALPLIILISSLLGYFSANWGMHHENPYWLTNIMTASLVLLAGLIIPVKTYPLWLKLFAELLPISNLLDWILSKNFLDQGLLIIIAKLFAWYIICLTSSRIKQKAF